MKAFRYIKYCAKGFFSKIIIMESIWLRKMAKKLRKSVFLITELESEKVIEFRPPLFFNFRGGHTSSTFSYSCSFLRYAFLGSKFTFQNTHFWEKSFCTAVSIPKRFHMTKKALCSEIHQPTLMHYAMVLHIYCHLFAQSWIFKSRQI